MDTSNFYVVTSIFNSQRYDSRYKLYKQFEAYMKRSEVQLVTVEVAYGERPFAVTESNNPFHIQLRTGSELWLKENALNIAISRLPNTFKYVATIDADVTFARPDWVEETVQQLQHNYVVQMFSIAQDLSPTYEPFQIHNGFVFCHSRGLTRNNKYGPYFHPGFAWAYCREALDAVGGLIDYAILGSSDYHMACGLIGEMDTTIHQHKKTFYAEQLMLWQQRAEKYIERDIGYVPGLLLHYWHGAKRARGYNTRWKILVEHDYDPRIHLKKDWQGLYQLSDGYPKFRDDIRKYFKSRNEDSIDIRDIDIGKEFKNRIHFVGD